MAVENEGLVHKQKLQAALHYSMGRLADAPYPVPDDDDGKTVQFSRPALATLTEISWETFRLWAVDIEAFAKHRQRSLVNMDDVLLLARRNPALKRPLEDICKPFREVQDTKKAASSAARTKRKDKAAASDRGVTKKESDLVDGTSVSRVMPEEDTENKRFQDEDLSEVADECTSDVDIMDIVD